MVTEMSLSRLYRERNACDWKMELNDRYKAKLSMMNVESLRIEGIPLVGWAGGYQYHI